MLVAANSGKKLCKSPYNKKKGAVRVKAYRSPKAYDENGNAYKMVLVREETLLSCMKTVLFTYLDLLDGMKDFLKQDTIQTYYREKIRNADMQIDLIKKQLEESRKDRKVLAETVSFKNPYIAHLEQFGRDETITRKLLEQLVSRILVFGSNELEFQFTFADEFGRMQEVIRDGGYAD